MRTFALLLALLPLAVAHAGYDLHLTRRTHWADEAGPRLERSEWDALASVDPEIRRDPRGDGSSYHYRTQHCSEHAFWWSEHDGELATTDPEQCGVAKLCRIAEALDASLQGDDGEFYCTPTP